MPEGHFTVPLGKAVVRRPGADLTILAYGTMVYVAEAAAAETGIDAEVIDLRTLLPLDLETIVASVKKTGRCVVVHEATLTSGFGAELAALVQENCFFHLEAPVARVAGWDTPYPHAQEWDYFPGPARVRSCARRNDGGLRWRKPRQCDVPLTLTPPTPVKDGEREASTSANSLSLRITYSPGSGPGEGKGEGQR